MISDKEGGGQLEKQESRPPPLNSLSLGQRKPLMCATTVNLHAYISRRSPPLNLLSSLPLSGSPKVCMHDPPSLVPLPPLQDAWSSGQPTPSTGPLVPLQ